MDDSGEDKKLMEDESRSDWKLNPKWEFTMHSTPQQNGLVEVEFATIANHAMAMCNAAHMNDRLCILFAKEVPIYSAALGDLVVNKEMSQTHYQLWAYRIPSGWYPGQCKLCRGGHSNTWQAWKIG